LNRLYPASDNCLLGGQILGWVLGAGDPNAGGPFDRELTIENLKLAGITDPTDSEAPWKLLDYVEKLLEIENWEGTGDSGVHRFIQYRLKMPSNQYIADHLLSSLLDFRFAEFFEPTSEISKLSGKPMLAIPKEKEEEYGAWAHDLWIRWYSLLYKGIGKILKEKPEGFEVDLQYIFRWGDAFLVADEVKSGNLIVEVYDELGAGFFFEAFGPVSEGPWWHTVDLVERLYTSGRVEAALDVCRISQSYFPLNEKEISLQLEIQEQFKTLAELMIQAKKQQNELLDTGFNSLRNLFEELLGNVRSTEGVSAELIAKAESIEQVLNGVVENIAKVRNKELSTEEMTSLLEDIAIPISVETEVEALQSNYQTIDKIGREFIEELAKCDYILKQDVAGMISDLLFLKLCKTLESLLIHSIVIHEGDLKMLSDSETPSQKQLDERIGKAEQILRSHLEGNKKLTLGSLIPLLDAIKDDECEEFVLLSELRKIHQDSLGDIRDVKHFISKPGQIGDDTKPIVEMRNVAAHSILEEGGPISEEHVKRLRLKLLGEAPHVLEIISRILNENK